MVNDLADSEIVLLAFFDEMCKWEIDSRSRSKRIASGELDPDRSHQESRDALAAIFSRFCVASDYSERGIRYQHPPEYNSRTEKVVSLRKIELDRIEIFTEQIDGWKHRRKFTLHRIAGDWRIASKHRINTEGEEIKESL